MKPYSPDQTPVRESGSPSDLLRIAVTFRRRQDGLGPTKSSARLSAASVMSFVPDAYDMDVGLQELHRHGFTTTVRGRMSASIRGTRQQFEKIFGTRLATVRLDASKDYQFHTFYYPPDGAPWNPDPALARLIDDAYIQWPHIYMARTPASSSRTPGGPGARPVSADPPNVDYWHLNVPIDLTRLLDATPIHRAGTIGAGVRVAMIDTGFYHSHPFFPGHGYSSSVVLAPGATNRLTDPGSHGTGESANIFSIAPGATFIGVKLENDADPSAGASILEGFQEALKHQPHVISVSLGYDLRAEDGQTPLSDLPGSLKALEAEIHAAIASGITVVFSAGNGHYSFPGQMPDVLSAGGVYVDADGSMRASDYASAFESLIYSGRSVPDFCGLVGLLPHADYIMLPVPPGQEIDQENSEHDKTGPHDGWAVFSGTSAAAPQLAAVCALLLAKNPGLKPADIKAILRRTAREITQGHANPASDPSGAGEAAADGAAGAGLVDAFAAWQQA
jgi:subtilisin family serine protease